MIKKLLDKQAALTVSVIMLVIGALLQLANIVVTPESMESIETVVSGIIFLFTTLGIGTIVRNYVVSKDTINKRFGTGVTKSLFDK